MTADIVKLSARSAAKDLTAEIEKTLKRWDAAGVDFTVDPCYASFTADHKREVVLTVGGTTEIRVRDHRECPGCPVACVLCDTRHPYEQMRHIALHGPVGGPRATMTSPVCAECITTGPLAPIFAAMERQAREAALAEPDPWAAS